MRHFLFRSIICSSLLIAGVNAGAELIDQDPFQVSAQQQIEKRQFSWPDGRLYDGEWMRGKPHGQGMLTYPDGGQYWGRFNAGKRQGEGMMKFVNGDEYEGEWFNDQPHGQGTFRFANGARYVGEFDQGKQAGNGRQTYADGTYYDGQWLHNVPHGYGRLTFASGGAYEGQFSKGQPHGHGLYYYANGDLYEGDWKQGKQDGKGRYDYATGGFYEGEVAQGKREGKGIWVTALGQRYEGSFKANKANGKGQCGSLTHMEPCTYQNGKRVQQTTVVAATPVTPKPATPKPQKVVTATSAVAAPIAMAQLAPSKSAVTQSAITTPTPPTSRVDSTTISAAKPVPPAASAIPTTKNPATFTQTLAKEKAQLKTLTVADLNQQRSDIYFNDNWQQKHLMSLPEQVWWKKRSSLFQDELEIVSQHGDTRIRMVIGHYKGPGRYELTQVSVESPSQAFDADSDEAGNIEILSDQDGWISGSFQFNVAAGNGRKLDVKDGVFRVSEASRQPSFLR